MKYKVIIIGGGPTGVFSAFCLKRFGINDLVIFEKNKIGGLIKYANLVENFPLLKPSSGIKVVDLLKHMFLS